MYHRYVRWLEKYHFQEKTQEFLINTLWTGDAD